jgi:hypothetical protein
MAGLLFELDIDRANRIVLANPFFQAFRKQRALPAIRALNEAPHSILPRIRSRESHSEAFSHSQGHFRQIDPLPTLSACPLRSDRVRTFAPAAIDAVCQVLPRAGAAKLRHLAISATIASCLSNSAAHIDPRKTGLDMNRAAFGGSTEVTRRCSVKLVIFPSEILQTLAKACFAPFGGRGKKFLRGLP